jgi:hypothetical protein
MSSARHTLPGVTVKARLEGHEFDLQDLADLLPAGDIRVARDDAGYYLEAAVIDNPPEGRTFYEAAQEILPLVNGMGRVKNPRFRPVALSGRYQDGEKQHMVVAVGTAEARSRLSAVAIVPRPDGQVEPQPSPPSISYPGLIKTDPEVAEVLQILASPSIGWVELYKVFEVVRDTVKPLKLDQSGLAGKEDISAFTASANRPDVSGAGARHARIDGGPPKRTMTLNRGRQFVSDLVRAWLETR